MKTSKDFEAAKVFCLIELGFCYFCYGEVYFWIFSKVEVLLLGNKEDVEVVHLIITNRMGWE